MSLNLNPELWKSLTDYSEMHNVFREINDSNIDNISKRVNKLLNEKRLKMQSPSDRGIATTLVKNGECNVNTQETKLEYLVTARIYYPELFSERPEENIREALNAVNIAFLPNFTKTGHRVSVYSLEDLDSSTFNPYAVCKLVIVMYDLITTFQGPATGDIVILDVDGVTMHHFGKIVMIATMIAQIMEKIYPSHLKELHVINAPPVVNKILKGLSLCLRHQISIFNHTCHNDLYKFIDQEILPSDYGGKQKSLSELAEEWRIVIKSNEEWLIKEVNVKATDPVPMKYASLNFEEDTKKDRYQN